MSKKEKVVPELDENQVRKNVLNDLNSAVALINLIRNDPEMLKAIQDIIIGRIKTEMENKAMQPELELNGIE